MPTREEVLAELNSITNPKPEVFTDLPLADLTDDEALASSKITPVEKLVELTTNSSPTVRSMAASNPSLDEYTLVGLANSDDHVVRAAVAYNASTPVELLETLSNDANYFVRMFSALNKNLSQDSVARLAADANESVRAAAARR
jgi:hypothetical protein